MRVSREKAAEHRDRIIDAAGALFRAKGFGGIGVADIMKAADLTHGGFYGHFASERRSRGPGQPPHHGARGELDQAGRGAAPETPYAALLGALSVAKHRDDPGKGCAFAALGNDAARSGKVVRKAFAEGLAPLIDILAQSIPGKSLPAVQGGAAPQGRCRHGDPGRRLDLGARRRRHAAVRRDAASRPPRTCRRSAPLTPHPSPSQRNRKRSHLWQFTFVEA